MVVVSRSPVPESEGFAVDADALVPVALGAFLGSEGDCGAVARVGVGVGVEGEAGSAFWEPGAVGCC